MNETTATALAYGIYKTDLPETDGVNVAFVDVGHSSTQVRSKPSPWQGVDMLDKSFRINLDGKHLPSPTLM